MSAYVALHYVRDPVAFGLGALTKGAGESVAIIGLPRIKSNVFSNLPVLRMDGRTTSVTHLRKGSEAGA